MRYPKRMIIAIIAVSIFAFVSLFIAIRKPPVLLHLFADTDCACGDYQQELSGIVLLNPLRDRTPERNVDSFFTELREGRCAPSTAGNTSLDCSYALDGHRVSEWRLAYRRDNGDTVELYYKLTSLGAEPKFSLTGEGLVKAQHTKDAWHVTYYSSYF